MATFLNLTNEMLRRLNEVPIPQADFPSVRGVQSSAKDMINSAIEDINTQEFEWPFNAALYTQVLTIDIEEYNFPDTLRTVKWNSFHVVKSALLNTNGRPLSFLSRELRNKFLKNDDDNSTPSGKGVPIYVFEKQGFGFGVSPSPDAAYTVTYEYFLDPVTLVDYDDEPTIPNSYNEAIIQRALYHMYMFRDNTEQAQEAQRMYTSIVDRMRTQMINKDDRIYSGMVAKTSTAPMSDYMNHGYPFP